MVENLFHKAISALRAGRVETYGVQFLQIPDVSSMEEALALDNLISLSIYYGEVTDKIHMLSVMDDLKPSSLFGNQKNRHQLMRENLLRSPQQHFVVINYDEESGVAEILCHIKEVKALATVVEELLQKIISNTKAYEKDGEVAGYFLETSSLYSKSGWAEKVRNKLGHNFLTDLLPSDYSQKIFGGSARDSLRHLVRYLEGDELNLDDTDRFGEIPGGVAVSAEEDSRLSLELELDEGGTKVIFSPDEYNSLKSYVQEILGKAQTI